jgi:hypothetical protein
MSLASPPIFHPLAALGLRCMMPPEARPVRRPSLGPLVRQSAEQREFMPCFVKDIPSPTAQHVADSINASCRR